MWVGVPILLSGCGFCCWRGWQYGAWGIWGFPGDGFLGGFGAGLRPLAWMGVLVTLGCCFSGRRHAALLGMPVPDGRRLPAWRPHCSGVGPGGGVWGSGGALPPGWGYGWAWGLWVLVGVPPGAWVGACAWGPALVWGSSMHRCLRRGAGPIEAGVNGLYLGVLLSYVVWELTG